VGDWYGLTHGYETLRSMKIRVIEHEVCCWVRLGLP
jgi:hypothetical protein